MILTDKIRPFGGMNKDADPKDIKEGDYVDALNIRHITNNGETAFDSESVLGNEQVFDMGVRDGGVLTNRTYRITLPIGTYLNPSTGATESITAAQYRFLATPTSPTEFEIVSAIDTSTYAGVPLAAFAYVEAEFASQIGTTPYTITYVDSVSYPRTTGATAFPSTVEAIRFDITFTPYPAFDFYININGYNGGDVGTYGEQQSISEPFIPTASGVRRIIGSYDLMGDLFIWSTPNTKEATPVTISNVINGSPIQITLPSKHGLATGDKVTVRNVGGTTSANGIWNVAVVDDYSFTLIGSVPSSAWTSGGSVILNPEGYGEIGVAVKDENTQSWTYTRLIEGSFLNFSTKHQIEAKVEVDGRKKSLYWTDNYNKPRVMYYYGEYMTDGFLSSVNPDGLYDATTWEEETILCLSAPNVILSVRQEESGVLKGGNWRYSVRMVVDGSAATEWSYMTNPINVYPRSAVSDGEAQLVVGYGPVVGEDTNKSHVITVSNLTAGIYNYVELAAIRYVGSVPVGVIVKRQFVPDYATSIDIVHTGRDDESLDLDITTLTQVYAAIIKAQNLVLMDKRCVLSNIELQEDYDLSSWALAIQYRILRYEMESLGFLNDTTPTRLAEYIVPANTTNYLGYMINETYRFGVEVKWKGANWSKPFFVADIKIDTTGAAGQRLSGLTNNSLTDSTGDITYIPYLQFTNVDLDYELEDGYLLRDKIEAIRFVRVDCIKEVLATGILIMHEAGSSGATPNTTYWVPSAYLAGAGDRKFGFLISPDIYFMEQYPANTGGLYLNYLDQPAVEYTYSSASGTIVELKGYVAGTAYTNKAINAVALINNAAHGNNLYRINTTTDLAAPALGAGGTDYGTYIAQVIRPIANKYGGTESNIYQTTGQVSVDIANITTSTNFDVFGGDTFNQKSYKKTYISGGVGHGISFWSQNRVNSQMLTVGTDANYTLPSPTGMSATNLDAFLVDTVNLNVNVYEDGYTPANNVQYYLAYNTRNRDIYKCPTRIVYSENKIINSPSDSYRIFLPNNYLDLWADRGAIQHMEAINGELFTWQPRKFERQYFNSRGTLLSSNTPEILVGDGSVLSREGDDLSKYGTSHKWSVVRGVSAGGKDVVYWVNTENKKIMRFGSDGTVPLSDIKGMQSFFANNLRYAQLYFAPADNLGICGGYDNRFSEAVITFRSLKKDISEAEVGTACSSGSYYDFGYDDYQGMPKVYKCISSCTVDGDKIPESGLSWETYFELVDFSDNNIYNYYSVAINEYSNKITTFYSFTPKLYMMYKDGFLTQHPVSSEVYEHNRGEYLTWYKVVTDITSNDGYVITPSGSSVVGTGTLFKEWFPFPETEQYYIAIDGVEYQVSSVSDDTHLTVSEDIVHTDVSYFEWSYSKAVCVDGHLEAVCNREPDIVKSFNAIRVNSEVVPSRIDFATEQHITYSEPSDIEDREGMFDTAIKNDATVTAENPTGSTEADTSRLWGRYLKIKISFERKKFQALYDLFCKFSPKSRLYNR